MLSLFIAICILGSTLEANLSLNQIEIDRISTSLIGFEDEGNWSNRVYLATYPRSGNHWMRYLIEEATGVATSSVYRDYDPIHLPDLFPWGGYCCDHGYEGLCRYPIKGETVVIKTHFPTWQDNRYNPLPYFRAVRIIRHPIDAFYSFYVYSNISWEFFIPKEVVREYIHQWRRFQEYWDAAENVLTIRYEDLYNNPLYYLNLILKYSGYQVDQENVKRAVAKYPPRGGLLKHIDHFTEEDISIIQSELVDLLQKYGYERTEISQLHQKNSSEILKLDKSK